MHIVIMIAALGATPIPITPLADVKADTLPTAGVAALEDLITNYLCPEINKQTGAVTDPEKCSTLDYSVGMIALGGKQVMIGGDFLFDGDLEVDGVTITKQKKFTAKIRLDAPGSVKARTVAASLCPRYQGDTGINKCEGGEFDRVVVSRKPAGGYKAHGVKNIASASWTLKRGRAR